MSGKITDESNTKVSSASVSSPPPKSKKHAESYYQDHEYDE